MSTRDPRGFTGWIDDRIMAIFAPQPLVRLEIIRIIAPLAIVGFMLARIVHADDWLSVASFRVPAKANDWRQPASFEGLSVRHGVERSRSRSASPGSRRRPARSRAWRARCSSCCSPTSRSRTA